MPQVFICYDLMEGLTNEEEDLIFEIEPELFSIGTIINSNEIVSLLSVRVSKIIINGKCEPQWGITNQGRAKVVASTTKTTKFNVRPKISMENKIYPQTYYHHNQAEDEIPTKI